MKLKQNMENIPQDEINAKHRKLAQEHKDKINAKHRKDATDLS